MSPRMPAMALPESTASISARLSLCSRIRCAAGAVDVGFARSGNVGELLAAGRVDAGKALRSLRRDPGPADVEAARCEVELGRCHGTIAARSTERSAAFLNARSICCSENFESTIW